MNTHKNWIGVQFPSRPLLLIVLVFPLSAAFGLGCRPAVSEMVL